MGRSPLFVTLLTLSLALPAALMCGCQALGLGGPPCPPDWTLNPPSDSTWATGVGQCGPTYLPQDGKDLALARAVNELAAQAGIAIESESLLVQKLEGSRFIQEWSRSINARAEGIIEGFEIVEWHHCDDEGRHSQPTGSTCVLIRMQRSELTRR